MRVPRQRRTALGSYSLAGTRSEPIFMSGGAPQGHVDSPEIRGRAKTISCAVVRLSA